MASTSWLCITTATNYVRYRFLGFHPAPETSSLSYVELYTRWGLRVTSPIGGLA